jgi:hypothetical protein
MAADETQFSLLRLPVGGQQIEPGNGRRTLNPMQILAKSYRGEEIG